MNSILHINASPRGDASRSLTLARSFLQHLQQRYPAAVLNTLDIFTADLPDMTPARVGGKYRLLTGADLDAEQRASWDAIVAYIDQFRAADIVVLNTPMWNFSIPYRLKHYIDIIVQPRYLFKYTAQGAVGLAGKTRMVIISARGSDYPPGSQAAALDQQEPYLRTIFGFVGIADITVVKAQPLDALGPDATVRVMEQTHAELVKLAAAL